MSALRERRGEGSSGAVVLSVSERGEDGPLTGPQRRRPEGFLRPGVPKKSRLHTPGTEGVRVPVGSRRSFSEQWLLGEVTRPCTRCRRSAEPKTSGLAGLDGRGGTDPVPEGLS